MGRRPKNITSNEVKEEETKVAKKRGRKPKEKPIVEEKENKKKFFEEDEDEEIWVEDDFIWDDEEEFETENLDEEDEDEYWYDDYYEDEDEYWNNYWRNIRDYEDQFSQFKKEYGWERVSNAELKEIWYFTDLITSNQWTSKVSKKLLTKEQELALFERMENSPYKEEIDTIRKFFVEKNIWLVVKNAKKLKQTLGWRRVKLEDLVQEWVMGFYVALKKFEYKLWNKLSTYATMWVMQRIRAYISDYMMPMRITGHRRTELVTINKIREEFLANGKEPTMEEIRAITWFPISRIRDLEVLMNWCLSLDTELGWNFSDGNNTYWWSLEAKENTEKDMQLQEVMDTITKALDKLTIQEKHLFQLHFGFENWKITNEWLKFSELEEETWIDRLEIRKSIKKAKRKVAEELIKHWIEFWNIINSESDDDFDE